MNSNRKEFFTPFASDIHVEVRIPTMMDSSKGKGKYNGSALELGMDFVAQTNHSCLRLE